MWQNGRLGGRAGGRGSVWNDLGKGEEGGCVSKETGRGAKGEVEGPQRLDQRTWMILAALCLLKSVLALYARKCFWTCAAADSRRIDSASFLPSLPRQAACRMTAANSLSLFSLSTAALLLPTLPLWTFCSLMAASISSLTRSCTLFSYLRRLATLRPTLPLQTFCSACAASLLSLAVLSSFLAACRRCALWIRMAAIAF